MYDALRDEGRWDLLEVLTFQARVRGDAAFVTTAGDGTTLSYAVAAAQADLMAG